MLDVNRKMPNWYMAEVWEAEEETGSVKKLSFE
jgi:hypothetical protein